MQSTQIADLLVVLLQVLLPAAHGRQVSRRPAFMAFQPLRTTILTDVALIGVAKTKVALSPFLTV